MSEFVRVVIGKAKLRGDESQAEISATLASQHALRGNGFIRNTITCDRNGKPEYICSMWRLSPHESGNAKDLLKGQRFAFILKSELEESCNGEYQ